LEEAYSKTPLLPKNEPARSRVRAFCNIIACDIHPLNNLRVLNYLKAELAADEKAVGDWYEHWINEGFEAAEALAGDGSYVFGNLPTLADCFLVPQMYNARRFKVRVDKFPKLVAIAEACNKSSAFKKAAPGQQPDATAS
ncbi:MAG: maleylacetoacetate isomerase, partial [Woeseiaceae bacterium]